MRTVLLLTQELVLLDQFVEPLRARLGGDVYFTSSCRLAVARDHEFAAVMASDDILDDFEDGDLQTIGQSRDTVHTCTVEFRRVPFLREVLLAMLPEIGVAWVDNDCGVILTLPEFVSRVSGLDDVTKL